MIQPLTETQTVGVVETWQLGEHETVEVTSGVGVVYCFETDVVNGGLLLMTVRREKSNSDEVWGVPRVMRGAHIATKNPHEPIISVGERLVVSGRHQNSGRKALLTIGNVAVINPTYQQD